jgi:hypothetical protein
MEMLNPNAGGLSILLIIVIAHFVLLSWFGHPPEDPIRRPEKTPEDVKPRLAAGSDWDS